MQYKVVHYIENGHDRFQEWLDDLRDFQAKTTIERKIKQVKLGNFGEHRFCRQGVWEFVIDTGPGYRIYYSMIENVVILLLCAGSKRTQQKDIDKAVDYLQDFKGRNE